MQKNNFNIVAFELLIVTYLLMEIRNDLNTTTKATASI